MSECSDHSDPAVQETPALCDLPSGTEAEPPVAEEIRQKWIQSWRSAAVELSRIDDEELRQLSDEAVLASICGTSLPCVDEVEVAERNGLVTLQAWFTRFRLLQLEPAEGTE